MGYSSLCQHSLPYSQGYALPSGHIQLWELDCKEGWALKNWCLQTVVLEKTPETPLDSKELKPVNLKRSQPWLLTGRRLMLKLKLQYFGHLMQTANSSLMQWTWAWANFERWWGTGGPGVLQSLGSQSRTEFSDWKQQTYNQWLLGKAPHWRLSSHFSRNPTSSWSSRVGTKQRFPGWAPHEDAGLH